MYVRKQAVFMLIKQHNESKQLMVAFNSLTNLALRFIRPGVYSVPFRLSYYFPLGYYYYYDNDRRCHLYLLL